MCQVSFVTCSHKFKKTRSTIILQNLRSRMRDHSPISLHYISLKGEIKSNFHINIAKENWIPRAGAKSLVCILATYRHVGEFLGIPQLLINH